MTKAQKAISDKLHLPPGYTVDWGGTFQNLQSDTARLALVVPGGLITATALTLLVLPSLYPLAKGTSWKRVLARSEGMRRKRAAFRPTAAVLEQQN